MSIRISISNLHNMINLPYTIDENVDVNFEDDIDDINRPKVSPSNSNDLSKLDISGISCKNSLHNFEMNLSSNIVPDFPQITNTIDVNPLDRFNSPRKTNNNYLMNRRIVSENKIKPIGPILLDVMSDHDSGKRVNT